MMFFINICPVNLEEKGLLWYNELRENNVKHCFSDISACKNNCKLFLPNSLQWNKQNYQKIILCQIKFGNQHKFTLVLIPYIHYNIYVSSSASFCEEGSKN